jgi:hypothetical protein
LVLVEAQSGRWGRAPAFASRSQRGVPRDHSNSRYAAAALAMAIRPRSGDASSKASTLASTRLTKKLATEATVPGGSPRSRRRSMPASQASITAA